MPEKSRETLAGREEAFDIFEGALCEGESPSEMGVGGQGRGEPVTLASDFTLGEEVEVV